MEAAAAAAAPAGVTIAFATATRLGSLSPSRDRGAPEPEPEPAAHEEDKEAEAEPSPPMRDDDLSIDSPERAAARDNPVWVTDAPCCMLCRAKSKKHHCRCCGWALCALCCPDAKRLELTSWISSTRGHQVRVDQPAELKRVCNSCLLQQPHDAARSKLIEEQAQAHRELVEAVPDDTWSLIASFCDLPEIAQLASVSRRFGVVAERGAILSAERHPHGKAGALQVLQSALQGNQSGALKCLWALNHPPAVFAEHAANIALTDGDRTATARCVDQQGWHSAVCGELMGDKLSRQYLEFIWSRGGLLCGIAPADFEPRMNGRAVDEPASWMYDAKDGKCLRARRSTNWEGMAAAEIGDTIGLVLDFHTVVRRYRSLNGGVMRRDARLDSEQVGKLEPGQEFTSTAWAVLQDSDGEEILCVQESKLGYWVSVDTFVTRTEQLEVVCPERLSHPSSPATPAAQQPSSETVGNQAEIQMVTIDTPNGVMQVAVPVGVAPGQPFIVNLPGVKRTVRGLELLSDQPLVTNETHYMYILMF